MNGIPKFSLRDATYDKGKGGKVIAGIGSGI